MLKLDVFDKRWATLHTIKEIYKKRLENVVDINNWNYKRYKYNSPKEYSYLNKGIIKSGERWEEDYTYFFEKEIIVPESFQGKNVYLALDIGGESEVYLNGQAKGSIDKEHDVVKLLDYAKGGETLSIKIQSTRDEHECIRTNRMADKDYFHHIFNSSRLFSKNIEVEEFYYLAKTVLELSMVYEENEVSTHIYEILVDVLFDIDYYEEENQKFQNNIIIMKERLLTQIQALKIPYIYGKAYLMGHSHLDLAFKWTWKETFRKIERTLSNTCELLNDNAHGVYSQSQTKIFEVLEEEYPEIHEKAHQLIQQGRIEPVGDVYVEFDTNIPSGESIIRQILYGREYARKHWGKESKVCYLPDTFGYSGILPQILIQAGYEYFVTTKLEWNDTNKFPYLYFNWEGIDGTAIFSHLMASGYGGDVTLSRIAEYSKDPRHKGNPCAKIYQYGAGDGGGGMNEDMFGTKEALKKLSCFVEVIDGSMEEGMVDIGQLKGEAPYVTGELYFEKHRGVYTSQAGIKKYNRIAELTLRDAEISATIAFIESNSEGKSLYEEGASAILEGTSLYPKKQLEIAWKKILFNQFHDIIAGSCISQVVTEAIGTYQEAIDLGKQLTDKALDNLQLVGNNLIVWNTLGWNRFDVLPVTIGSNEGLYAYHGERLIQQTINIEDQIKHVLVEVDDIPSIGYKQLIVRNDELHLNDHKNSPEDSLLDNKITEANKITADNKIMKDNIITADNKITFDSSKTLNSKILENSRYAITFDESGEMTHIWNKAHNREELTGKGNALIAYVDRPGYFESWDVVSDFERKAYPIQEVSAMDMMEEGPIRWTLKIVKRFRNSIINQYISIYRANPRIDIRTDMDFYEHQMLLKASFEVDVHSENATYDISMGNLKRPTTNHNSMEAAMFEVNMHKWVDLSDETRGISILNDSKYGCDVKQNKIRITLLKTATFPDPNQDIGHHEFVYSLLPHQGDHRTGNVVHAAYELNIPSICKRGSIELNEKSWIRTLGHDVVIETIKVAEDDNSIIIRMYESAGTHGSVKLNLNLPLKSAIKCGVLEKFVSHLMIEDNQIQFHVKPYEIITIKILI